MNHKYGFLNQNFKNVTSRRISKSITQWHYCCMTHICPFSHGRLRWWRKNDSSREAKIISNVGNYSDMNDVITESFDSALLWLFILYWDPWILRDDFFENLICCCPVLRNRWALAPRQNIIYYLETIYIFYCKSWVCC